MGTMHYRPAVPGDRDSIAALHIEGGQQAYAGILPRTYLFEVLPQEKDALWRQRLDRGVDGLRLSVTVAESSTDIAGFACFLFDQKTDFGTYLHNIYVSSRYQRRGVASGLLVAGIDTFSTALGERPVHLLVFLENLPARALYDRLGGQIVEQFVRDYDGHPSVGLVRYQWASAQQMKQAALNLAPMAKGPPVIR